MFYDFIYLAKGFRMRPKVRSTLTYLVFRNYLPWSTISAANDDDFNLQSDCFVCAILTHGEEGVVYGTDDKVEVKILLEPFKGNNCKGLVGKPKIFFIQVRCQVL